MTPPCAVILRIALLPGAGLQRLEQEQTLEGEPGPCGIYVDTSHTDWLRYSLCGNYCPGNAQTLGSLVRILLLMFLLVSRYA
jgi:hypothetical protein